MLASSRGPRRRKPRGRVMTLPLQTLAGTRPNGTAARIRTAVGRDALIPPRPAPPQPLRADIESAPATGHKARSPKEKPQPCRARNPL